MRILYLDFLYPIRHIRQNNTYIRLLSNIAKVYVISPKGRYQSLPKEVEVIEKDSLVIKGGRLLNRLSSLKIMIISATEAIRLKPDCILISSYETMVFAIGRLFFHKKAKLYLLQHYNVDELKNGVKRCLFKTYMRKVDHIVFEDFIKNYLIDTFGLEENRVHILPHQLNQNPTKACSELYKCVGLSYSNDEKVISEIVSIEKDRELLKKANCKVVLKSKLIEFDNGFLKVIKGYIEDKQFSEYIDNCRCIYMPFPSSFRYRMSGTLVDAFSNNKILLGNDIPIIQYYASKYPNLCKIVNSAEDFFEYVLNIDMRNNDNQVNDFEMFRIEHSDRRIEEALKAMFDVIDGYESK